MSLREHIECYWVLRSDHGLKEELCLPEGSASLVFNFGPAYSRAICSRPNEWTDHGRCTLSHQGRESVLITQAAPVEMLGVRFKPYGLSSFFRISMMSLTPPFLVDGIALERLIGQWDKAISHDDKHRERVQEVESFLLGRLAMAGQPDPLVKNAVAILMNCEGNLRIAEVLEQLCVSKSTLEKKFQESVGISPKILCNILRFNSLVYKQRHHPLPTLTELTYNKGFFDQSHLVRNFRSFTGMTPSHFFRKDHHLVEMLRQSFEARVNTIYCRG